MVRPRQITDEQIFESARDCFLEHGPGVSTTVIAERCGVSQAALFKRFGTKEELMLAALLPPECPAFLALMTEAPAPGPVEPQLYRILLGIAEGMRTIVPHMMVLRDSGLDHRAVFSRYEVPPPVRSRNALAAWLDAAVASGQLRPHDTTVAAIAMLGAVQARVFWEHITREPFPPEQYIAGVVDLLWRGLAPAEAA